MKWHFIKKKYKLPNSSETGISTQQNYGLSKIKLIMNKLAELRQAVILLGDQLKFLNLLDP